MSERRSVPQGSAAAADVPAGDALAPTESRDAAPGMIVHRREPLNAEPPGDRLRAALITPQDAFYVRAHGPIPTLARDGYRLKIGGAVAKPMDLTLDELQSRFRRRTVTAVMQCAGNRRSDMSAFKPVDGDPWRVAAIGNAEWEGIGLDDVLREAGVQENAGLHVAFEAHDDVEEEGRRFSYAVSIPLAKAMASETILAFSMNGETLTPAHGFPVRVVTPGFAGARSPKWLVSVTVQDRPSQSPIQQKMYKLFPREADKPTADWSRGTIINEMPLNSAICEPAPHAALQAGVTAVRGYAIATARRIARVEVSADGGRNWQQAELEQDLDAPWGWTFWSAGISLERGHRELVVRAWNSLGETQPNTIADVWNFPGYLCTAWHRVAITVS